MNKRALGKGLEALFGSSLVPSGNEPPEESLPNDAGKIGIEKITPNKFQPRRHFDKEALIELAGSIKEHGIIQPVVVRRTDAGYELVAGERRLRAAQIAGLTAIPAIVREYSDSQMLQAALIENIQRQDLNPIEDALAYRQLSEQFGLTQEEIAQKTGKSRPAIANSVRLLNLHPKIQDFILKGALTTGQARPRLSLEDPETQMDAAIRVIAENYSARDAEELVKKIMTPVPEIEATPFKQNAPLGDEAVSANFDRFFVDEYEDRLKLALGAKVKIKPGKLKSKIEIEFYSSEDLERIVDALSIGIDKPESYSPKYKGPLVV